jgi:adenylate kinase family enzyme
MRILMIAPPGAGKGTQGGIIAAHFGIRHIATGDLLRAHVASGTPLGLAVKRHVDAGELVPDDIVLKMVREAMVEAKRSGVGFVLDGVPRTMAQAKAAYDMGGELGMPANVALYLKADDAELTRRLLARAVLEHRIRRHRGRHRAAARSLPRRHPPDRRVVPPTRNPRLRRRDATCRRGRARDSGGARGHAAPRRSRAGGSPTRRRPNPHRLFGRRRTGRRPAGGA